MSSDPFAAIEYESIIFSRHHVHFTGRAAGKPDPLDSSAYTLLTLLQVRGASTINELSTVTGLDISTLNRQTKALMTKGLAERIPDPDGGIARKFQPTEHGNFLINEERSSSHKALAEVLDDWQEEERTQFAHLLEKMNRAVEKRTGRPWPRP